MSHRKSADEQELVQQEHLAMEVEPEKVHSCLHLVVWEEKDEALRRSATVLKELVDGPFAEEP